MGGLKFERKWGHSYFSYLVGVEDHRLGGAHLHVAIDARISFATVHCWWIKHCGYAWTTAIHGDGSAVTAYVLKHVVKDDSAPTWFLQQEPRECKLEAGRWQVVRRATAPVPVKGVLARVP
jgi:hypothetical protein